MHKNGVPQRRCIGCMESKDKTLLIRMTYLDRSLHVDEGVKSPGRGFYLCKDINCLEKAIKKKAFSRVLKTNINDDELNEIKSSVERIVNAGKKHCDKE